MDKNSLPMYKLSVVSGGKLSLPRIYNRSATCKSVSCLTHDGSAFVTPFNNQIKVYSIETRQCIKTLKFVNNEVLGSALNDDSVQIVHVGLVMDGSQDKIIIYTNDGKCMTLNYKGKLINVPEVKLLDVPGEVLKVTKHGNRLITTEATGNTYKYNLYELKNDTELTHLKTFQNVLLSTWSNNDSYVAIVYLNEDSKKQIAIESLLEGSNEKSFPVPSTSSSNTTNSQFISSLAIDDKGQQLAIGFASGVINLINLNDLSHRLLKWHIDAVLSLGFNADGSYLLSGGWEKVLSFWQLSTNLQQFLPRLNGVVVECTAVNDKYYSIALQFAENNTNADYQIILLNAADLSSLLSINGPFSVFESPVKDIEPLISTVHSKNSVSSSTILQTKKKQKRKLLKGKKKDYTVPFAVHPLTKHLYFPHISSLQCYDLYKNEQIMYKHVTSSVSSAMGKVRSELTLQDPRVQDVTFTLDGKSMITYEVEYPPEGLLSSKELSHVLKFWQLDDNKEWQLKTKVLNPHGPNVPITCIQIAPKLVNHSQGCLTADNNGGIKFWKFDTKENNWCLSKLLLPNFNHFSNSIQLAWSLDGSLIFHSFEEKLTIINFDEFRKLDEEEASKNEITLDSPVQALRLVNDTILLIATKTSLNAYNLLTTSVTSSFDIFPFVNGIYKPRNLARLIACDETTGRIAIVINQQLKNDSGEITHNYKSRVVIFNYNLTKKLGVFEHTEYIASIAWNFADDFIFMDTQSRLGIVSATSSTEMIDEINNDSTFDSLQSESFKNDLRELSQKKSYTSSSNGQGTTEETLEFINGNIADSKTVNMNSFVSLFENIDNVQMETLFDRVMKVIM